MATEKEATVYIVDMGASMGERRNGRNEPDLDYAMRYVWDKLTSTVATARKTLMIGVVGLRTDVTSNELQDDDSFKHIQVLQPICQLLLPNLTKLRETVTVSQTNDGDAISALVIAIQMISHHCKKLKYRRKIVLVTNGQGSMDDDGLEDIAKKLKEDGIQLVVLGIEFDDPEYGFKEEDKDPGKASHEQLLKRLVDQCDGVFGTMEQAISEMDTPVVRTYRPSPTFKGHLTLGDPESTTPIISIEVWRYPRTMVAKTQSASQFVVRHESTNAQSSVQSSVTVRAEGKNPEIDDAADAGLSLAAVKNTRTYQVVDESAIGGKRDVDRDKLAKGYEYGRTAVSISESDENVTKFATTASLQVIGFVPRPKYERYMNMSLSSVIIALGTNAEASLALSSFIHALFEVDSYAVARLVTKDDKPPVVVLLAPSIEAEYECLIDVQLPFAEDVRSYRFPPLDKIVTISGKVLSEHRNLPNADLRQAMSDYVDQMDLSELGRDEEGQPTEYMAIEDTYSPMLHRIDQAIRWRAIHPSDPIPPTPEILTRYSKPPVELEERAHLQLEKLIATADIKKVPPKQKGHRQNRDTIKPLSGLNVDELLGREKRKTISVENAVPEFKQLLATAHDPNAIDDASKQMSSVIVSLIKHSLGNSGYGRAVEALGVMREQLIEMEEPKLYNDFITDLKGRILNEELNGERREMWWEIRRNRLGLIDVQESDLSEVGEEEAKLFLSSR